MKLGNLSLKVQFTVLMSIFLIVVATAGSLIAQSIVVSQTVNESRSVADMAEHIGRWASQYGGVHIKRQGLDTANLGSYLQRSVYAENEADTAALTAALATPALLTPKGGKISIKDELAAVKRMEAYHWKNPALIQREVSDIAATSSSLAKFRITSKTVLNKNNAPTPFEKEAIAQIDADFASQEQAGQGGAAAGTATTSKNEYWKVEKGHVLYARTLIAQQSCLKCHASFEKAPEFLKTNDQFNGGGGFGYVEGKPAGIISVTIPLPDAGKALSSSLTKAGWIGLGAIMLSGLLLIVFVGSRIISPMDKLRSYAQSLSTPELNADYDVPEFAKNQGPTNNEVHLLANSIHDLGQALMIVYGKMREARK